MKPIVIYHANCTDGFGAAFAAWLKFGDNAEYLPMNYGGNSAGWFDTANRDVYILDFSFPKEQMDLIIAGADKTVWLDHHKTAFEAWCGKYEREMRWHELQGWNDEVFILLDDNKSGAMLAWEYFHPGTVVPALIKHIDDRDRWQFKMEGSKELHAALGSYQPWSFDKWHNILDLTDSVAVEQMIDEGWAIIRAQAQNVKRMAEQSCDCRITFDPESSVGDGAHGYAVNSCIHQSELGHELANSSNTYGLVWYLAENGRVNCSLRSNGDYDVSAIAKAFGGGGHKNAAGFETDVLTVLMWLA